MVELDRELQEDQLRLEEVQKQNRMLKEEVDAEDVAEVVSNWTGIPLARMMESDVQKLIQMDERLKMRVIGQDDGIQAVSSALRRARSGLQDPNRPIGSFIFLGPTGVGKTELARALAEFMFDNEHAMIRIDMSEYMEKHAVARLVGAPPGYVGYEEGGYLTEAVRRKPYSVLLFDEIEKAHPDVFNILLQILDDGRLTDGQGRTVDFKNTVVIMTSNVGSQWIQDPSLDDEERKNRAMEALRATFKPEFLNRIDEIIMFKSLTRSEIKEIVRLQLEQLKSNLAERGLSMRYTDKLLDHLTKEAYHPQFGPRTVKRLIQRELLNSLSKALLSGSVQEDSLVEIDESGGEILFRSIINPE